MADGKTEAAILVSQQLVPAADSAANLKVRDVSGNKTDAAVIVVGTTKSLQAYEKGILTQANAIKAKTDLIPAVPMPSTIPAQVFPFTNPATLLSLPNLRLLADCGPYALSDDVLFAHDAESSLDAQAYTKVKEINVGYFSGTIRVAFSVGCSSAHDTHGRIYKNGVETAGEGNNGGDFYEYKFDLAFEPNDLLQLYVFNASAGFPVKFKNFRILGKFPVPTIPAITL